jgi:F-type H+-transporting ATPase subunit b
LKSAETARAEMANLKSENEKLLQEARIERDKLLKEARSMKEQIITVGKEQAAIEAAKILETAKRQIESERRATLVELKNQVGQLSVDLAEKILKRKLEDEAQQLSFANDQIKDAALLTAGAFVEGLYLTCGLIHDYPPTGLPKAEQDKILVPLVNAVIKQEDALSSLIELLQKVNDNDEVVTSIIAGLEKSKAIYAKGNWAERIANNKGDLIPTENDIKDLAKSISELRKSMVE